MSVDDDLSALAGDLDRLAERLADLALDRLRAAADPDGPDSADAEQLERRLTRARRAVEKASGLLRGPRSDDGDL